VNSKIRKRLARHKRRIERRLDKRNLDGLERPAFTASNIHYEMAGRTRAVAAGGIGALHLLARRLGLIEALDEGLQVLKLHLPYHESDHVLNLAYNALAGGGCLEHLELLRNDENYLDALGARRIPDPTTAGDFCRRFEEGHIRTLLSIIHRTSQRAWKQQTDPAFFEQAFIDTDGVIVETGGECKQGIALSYDGRWGYHPLVVSLANTGEVLSLVNRSGNRPSHEGAAAEADRAIVVCREGGFRQIVLRGDTDFTQTKELDRWDADGVQFLFGKDNIAPLHVLADDLPDSAWKTLVRPPRYEVQTEPRGRRENQKLPIIRERGYDHIRLEWEEVAQMPYRPVACKNAYRLIVVRKNLSREEGKGDQRRIFPDYRYFFYLTNDWESAAAELVLCANDRCDQENLNAQLLGGVRSLKAPLDTLLSNWAYMVMTMLAWNLKAWFALSLPEPAGRYQEQRREEKRRVLRMEFKTFVNAFVRIPCQVVRTARRLVFRLLAWNPWQGVFFRLLDQLALPLRN
jgi:hypothetical protein